MSLESLRYKRGSLQVLDQLLLPHETKYVEVLGVEDAWKVIRSMQVRGAPLIAITAALGLAVEASDRLNGGKFASFDDAVHFVLKSVEYLRSSRPTAVNLFLAMDEITEVVKSIQAGGASSTNQLIDTVVLTCEKIWEEDVATNRAIGFHGAQKIVDLVGRSKIRVLTICNTGSLATAGFGTALGVVRALHELGRLEHVYACETRPYNQGARLTAYEIVVDKLPGTLITDSMASALMAVKGVDVVVVGADRVAANGDTANKIGTYQLAIAAQFHHIPFFAAVPSTTLDLSMSSGAQIHVEERPGHELTSIGSHRLAPEGIAVWNPAFDVTPCSLLRGVITELGVIDAEILDPQGMSRNSERLFPIAQVLTRELEKIIAEKGEQGLRPMHRALLQRCRAAVSPIVTPVAYRRMDLPALKTYLSQQEDLRLRLGLQETDTIEELDIQEVGDGNLNFVYIVSAPRTQQVLVLKQALPFVRCIGETWPLTLQRAEFEALALREERRMTEGKYVPEVYLYDRTHAVIAMRYVEAPHIILRKALIANQRVTSFAAHLGDFLALTLFRSSALVLSGSAFRSQVAHWSQNTAMCALTEKVIFTDPYTASPLNHWTQPHLADYAMAIRQDTKLKRAAAYYKQVFLTQTQALLHADLHTGSVMVKEGSTFVIDPEFGFYGPMGFDVAAFLSNLYLAYFSKSVATGDEAEEYANWILDQAVTVVDTFQDRFRSLWQEAAKTGPGLGELYPASLFSAEELNDACEEYLRGVWRDTLGFIGLKMIRRIVGVAHVADLEKIEDSEKRSVAEKRALVFARKLTVAAYQGDWEKEKMADVRQVNDAHAKPLFAAVPSEQWVQ